jgi:hypothetical protein
MTHTLTLPVVAGLSILGGTFGLYLGKSAIAEINPIYYSEAHDRFHADLVPYRGPGWAQVQSAEDPGYSDGPDTACPGCRDYPEEYRPVADAAAEAYADSWSAGPPEAMQAAQPTSAIADPEREQVERYAAYPVTAEAEAAEAPAPAEDGAAD